MHTDEPIGTAILYVESTVAPEALKDFTEWCNTVHHFDTMKMEGFLSLRRFELLDGQMAPEMKRYELLTLYQIADANAADFTTPAYLRHTETYVRPPDGVIGNIDFQRSIYGRVEPAADKTQQVGLAMIVIRRYGRNTKNGTDYPKIPSGNILSTYTIRDEQMSGLMINCEVFSDAQYIYGNILKDKTGIANSTIQLYRQAFPVQGVLLRDREFRK